MDLLDWLSETVPRSDRVAGRASGDPRGTSATEVDPAARAAQHAELVTVRDRLGSVDPIGRIPPDGPPSEVEPPVLTDGDVRALVSCEGLAVARSSLEPAEVTWAMLRGRALDAFVEHVLFAGPVAEATAALRSIWSARESLRELELLDDLGVDEDRARDLTDLAARAMAFAGCRGWVPRTEVRMSVFVPGRCELRGRVDVLFGGPGTGLPAVLVEVKSGPIRDEHRAQLRHYVLLAALRHGEVPAGAALWSARSGLEPVHIPGVLHSSAERVAAALGSLRALRFGAEPVLRPGVQCRFCPVSSDCVAAAAADKGSGEAAGLHDEAEWAGRTEWTGAPP